MRCIGIITLLKNSLKSVLTGITLTKRNFDHLPIKGLLANHELMKQAKAVQGFIERIKQKLCQYQSMIRLTFLH